METSDVSSLLKEYAKVVFSSNHLIRIQPQIAKSKRESTNKTVNIPVRF